MLFLFPLVELLAEGSANGSSPSTQFSPDYTPGLPTVDALMSSPAGQRLRSETYRIGRANVTCVVGGGALVGIVVVEDSSDFLFLGLRSAYGPVILANQRRVQKAPTDYAVFSFYRECAIHAIVSVSATSVLDAIYDSDITMVADCLAVSPTLRALEHAFPPVGITQLAIDVKKEHNSRDPIGEQEFQRCKDQRYASSVALKLHSGDKFQTKPSVVLTESAIGAPALANFGEQLLVAGWTSADKEHHLNLATSADGRSFGGKLTIADSSIDGPALAASNGKLFLGWTTTGKVHRLSIMSSTDLQSFGNKVTLQETSPFAPALAVGNGHVYLAWVGATKDQTLNVMSSTDGRNFGNKVTLKESSGAGPHITFIDGTLYLLWRGTDANHRLCLIRSSDGQHFSDKFVLADSSDYAPALLEQVGLWLGWSGRDSAHSLNLATGAEFDRLGHKQTNAHSSVAAPALSSFKNEVYLSWSSADVPSHVYVAQLEKVAGN